MAVMEMGGKKFEIPQYQACCEKCGTTNFIYDDMQPPYKCDDCGAELDAKDFEAIDPDELQYEHDEGKYDGEV